MNNQKYVLVTGGAGYIGSTIASALEENGYTPIILDNLCVGTEKFVQNRIFYKSDIADTTTLNSIFSTYKIYAVIHCAALIVVPDSVSAPATYYATNVGKTISMLDFIRQTECKNIIFSSTAAMYASPKDGFEVTEESAVNPITPYSRSKLMMEQIIADCALAYNLRTISLRYFNPIGADPKFRSGPYKKMPSHVLGQMLLKYQGLIDKFKITGNDFPTPDGTGIRDYIHVWDIASAHVLALDKIEQICNGTGYDAGSRSKIINLGTGKGTSVGELVRTFEEITGKSLEAEYAPRRDGDVAGTFASNKLAKELLGWQLQYSITDAIKHDLEWLEHKKNL